MSKVSLIWATDYIDMRIAAMARVSNPSAKLEDPYEKLIGYLIEHKHWSPLEMANICVSVETTRDIGRQLIRHRSLHFQEFSQRYARVEQEEPVFATARLQDTKNRQNSIIVDNPMLQDTFQFWQDRVWAVSYKAYQACLALGIAKEVARKLLPEGLTQTTMYVNGTVRDWYHYLSVRLDPSTQYEHRELAEEIYEICIREAPAIFKHLRHY